MVYKLYYEESGDGDFVVLIPGLLGSRRFWDSTVSLLSDKFRLIALDLLGFGKSPKPRNCEYSIDVHVSSIEQTILPKIENAPSGRQVILVGISMGALLAIEFAKRNSSIVQKLILISPPFYKSSEEASSKISTSVFAKAYLSHGFFAGVVCELVRLLNPLFKFFTPFFVRSFPRPVVEDFFAHNWISYSRSLRNVIENQDFENLKKTLEEFEFPVVIIYGDMDDMIVEKNILEVKNKNVKINRTKGSHMLPLEEPEEIVKVISG